MNCVTTRELPSLAVSIESSRGPIQLKGRKRVKASPCRPYAQMTRSSICLQHE